MSIHARPTSIFFLGILSLILWNRTTQAQEVSYGTIDRKALVRRHNIVITHLHMQGPTQVGNGDFAYGFDITGMQTFNTNFTTMSDWGWHSMPISKGLHIADFKKTLVNTHGKMVSYYLPNPKQPALTNWLIQNPQKFNLGRIGLRLIKKDGTSATLDDLQNPLQVLDLWTGIAKSKFTVEGQQVQVTTVCDPHQDAVSFKIVSPLIKTGRLEIFVEFPYASSEYFSNASDYNSPSLHHTQFILWSSHSGVFNRIMDTTLYTVSCRWTGTEKIIREKEHLYYFLPDRSRNSAKYVFLFSPSPVKHPLPTFAEIKVNSGRYWPSFWKSGGAIDLSKSKDPRWFELERRIVLSQYVMAINAAGCYPPAETGLVNNSWYGKFHYEMYWWHEAQYALWNRWYLLNRSLHLYKDNLKFAIQRAHSQGYQGARWLKCTGPKGRGWPDLTHAFLIWQEPHPIFFADLDYRAHPNIHTLRKWQYIIRHTADFMASYAFFDTSRDQYVLGPPIRVVSENNDAYTTKDPAFELAYWRFGLKTAQEWFRKLHLPPNPKWGEVLKKLAPLPMENGLYVQWEGIDGMWTKYNYEHPALTGIFGVLPGYQIDTAIMQKTFEKVEEIWDFNRVWGWDFPMVAMCAARLGHPAQAVNMLLDSSARFHFDEHGFVGGDNPYPYIPSNGGLLYAVAMMTAGWDGDKKIPEPGFPKKDSSWVVEWEGLKKAP